MQLGELASPSFRNLRFSLIELQSPCTKTVIIFPVSKLQKPPRNHHYVPQLLLWRFTNAEGRLWIYDLEKGKIYPGNPQSAGFERDLYAITAKDGTTDFASIEDKISKSIDAPGDRAIRRILRQETLGKDWNDFLGLVAAQLQRTPAYLDRLSASMQPMMQEMLERMANHDPDFRKRIQQRFLKSGSTEAEIEALLESVGKGGCKVKPSRGFVLMQAMRSIEAIHAELSEMKWQIGTLEPSETDLILGDHPALPVVPKGEHAGLRNPNIDLILPLTTRVAAVGNWDGRICYGTFSLGMAEWINTQTMRHAKRFLFASSDSNELLQKAEALHGAGPKLHTTRVHIGKKLTIVNEYR